MTKLSKNDTHIQCTCMCLNINFVELYSGIPSD